jgi:hypothetical protein
MRRDLAPYTLQETINQVVSRLDRVERKPDYGMTVIVQPDEPDVTGLRLGQLWFDTDEPIP